MSATDLAGVQPGDRLILREFRLRGPRIVTVLRVLPDGSVIVAERPTTAFTRTGTLHQRARSPSLGSPTLERPTPATLLEGERLGLADGLRRTKWETLPLPVLQRLTELLRKELAP